MEHGSCFLADAVVGDDRRYAIEAAERGELQCQAATTHQRTQIGQTSPVTNFSVATNEYRGGEERTEYHSIVTWERLAEICGQFLGKGQMVSLEGRLQTRRWEDDRKLKHYRTEIVANSVEMLSGRRKKDYAAETAAQALETQAEVMGLDPLGPDDYADGEGVEPLEAAEPDEDVPQAVAA